jgi:hypothetical protein
VLNYNWGEFMNNKIGNVGMFLIIFAVYFTTLSIIGSPFLSFVFVLIYRMLENGLLIFLPFIIMRKKPAKQQVFTAIGLIILLEFIWHVIIFIAVIFYEYMAAGVFFALILNLITVALLLFGAFFIQNMKFVKPDKPLVISMIVYIIVSLVGAVLSSINVLSSFPSFTDGTASIMDIMDTVMGYSDGFISRLSNLFSSTVVRAIIGSVFVFFLVRFMRKRETAHDPVPE